MRTSWLIIIHPSLLTHTCARCRERGRGPSTAVSLQHKSQAAFLIWGLDKTLGAAGGVLGPSSQRLHTSGLVSSGQRMGVLGPVQTPGSLGHGQQLLLPSPLSPF